MALLNPANIYRHYQFKKDVDFLKSHGVIRHYTVEISKKTGEGKGNITNYYKGTIPIGDKFLKKFEKAYEVELKVVRGTTEYKTSDQNAEFINTVAKEAEYRYEKKVPPSSDLQEYLDALTTRISLLEKTVTVALDLQLKQGKMLQELVEAGKKKSKKQSL